jgi:hypothetical protein
MGRVPTPPRRSGSGRLSDLPNPIIVDRPLYGKAVNDAGITRFLINKEACARSCCRSVLQAPRHAALH